MFDECLTLPCGLLKTQSKLHHKCRVTTIACANYCGLILPRYVDFCSEGTKAEYPETNDGDRSGRRDELWELDLHEIPRQVGLVVRERTR